MTRTGRKVRFVLEGGSVTPVQTIGSKEMLDVRWCMRGSELLLRHDGRVEILSYDVVASRLPPMNVAVLRQWRGKKQRRNKDNGVVSQVRKR